MCDEHGGDAVNGGRPLALDSVERGRGGEGLGRNDHGRAVDRGAESAQHAAEAVVERHRNADAVVGRHPLAVADVVGVQQQVAVRERGGLGKASSAGGVLNVNGVARLEIAADRHEVGPVDVAAAVEHFAPGDGARRRLSFERHDPP